MRTDAVVFQTERIVPRLTVPGSYGRTPVARAVDRGRARRSRTSTWGLVAPTRSLTVWEAALARWRQLTFYVLDPDSWC
jgi:hypothetical protein